MWTPIGLMQPTVLPFGQKNSGTEAQGPYLLAAKRLKQVSNYVDDWLGYANEFDELLRNFKDFLAVCLEYSITLTSKTKFGFPQAQFFGFKVNTKGTQLAFALFAIWSPQRTSRNCDGRLDSSWYHASICSTMP